jgi:predicted GIY-YIG superfamily endonuclease
MLEHANMYTNIRPHPCIAHSLIDVMSYIHTYIHLSSRSVRFISSYSAYSNLYILMSIYMLKDRKGPYYYIGSTTNSLNERLNRHRDRTRREPHNSGLVHRHFENRAEDMHIVEIEKVGRGYLKDTEKRHICKYVTDTYCLNENIPYAEGEDRDTRIRCGYCMTSVRRAGWSNHTKKMSHITNLNHLANIEVEA